MSASRPQMLGGQGLTPNFAGHYYPSLQHNSWMKSVLNQYFLSKQMEQRIDCLKGAAISTREWRNNDRQQHRKLGECWPKPHLLYALRMNLHSNLKEAAAGKAECLRERQAFLKGSEVKGLSWRQKMEESLCITEQRTQRVGREEWKKGQKHCRGVSMEGLTLGSNHSGSGRLQCFWKRDCYKHHFYSINLAGTVKVHTHGLGCFSDMPVDLHSFYSGQESHTKPTEIPESGQSSPGSWADSTSFTIVVYSL